MRRDRRFPRRMCKRSRRRRPPGIDVRSAPRASPEGPMPTRIVRWLAAVSLAVPVLGIAPWPAREVVLSGIVTDRGSGAGVDQASVVVEGTRIGALTDAAGRYRLAVPIESDSMVRLVVRRLGYQMAQTD